MASTSGYPLNWSSTCWDEHGRACDSLGELAILDYVQTLGIPFLYNQPLRAPDRSLRQPDFTFPCTCGRDVVTYEYLGGWDCIRGYKERWECETKPWYRRNRGWIVLYGLVPPLNRLELRRDMDEIMALLANDGELLHEALHKQGGYPHGLNAAKKQAAAASARV